MRASQNPSTQGRARSGWRVILPAVACLLASLPLAANDNDLGPVFRTLSVAEGLPDSRIEAVVQDERGYIWIGTQGGLVRHDGQQLRVVGSDPDLPDPLPGQNIMALMAASDGSVWAAVENAGAVQIGPDLRRLEHLAPRADSDDGRLPEGNIWSMAEDCRGRVWLAFMRGGVAVHDPESGDLRVFEQKERHGLSPDGFQMHLAVDSECRVWLVQSGRLLVLGPDEQRFRKVYEPDTDEFMLFLLEAGGTLYFNQGPELMALGPVDSAPRREPERVLETEAMITGMAFDDHSDELLITTVAGLYRWPRSGEREPRRIRSVEGLADGLPTERLHGVTIDREGGLWLRQYRHGLAYMPPGTDAFARYQPLPGRDGPPSLDIDPVTALAWDAGAETFWLGSMLGRFHAYSPAGEPPDLHTDIAGRLDDRLSGNVVDIEHRRNELIAISQQQVVRTALTPDAEVEVLMRREQIDEGTFRFAAPDARQRLWVGTFDVGMFRLDPDGGRREHFHPDGEGRLHLPESSPRDMLRGPDGGWWLIGEHTIYRWREARGFDPVAELGDGRLAAALWHEGALWTATHERLQRWNRGDGAGLEASTARALDELPTGRVLNLVADGRDGLWLVRSSGLARFDTTTDSLRHVSRRDGVASVEFQENAAQRLPDGRVAAGGRGGIVVVDPDRLRQPSHAPEVRITRLQAGDKEIDLTSDQRGVIELAHDRNSLFIDYLATSYIAPERNRYRVRLEGWDDEWLNLTGQTRHYYSSLPPGEYRFRVQAAAPDGPWNEAGDELALRILRPPWLSGGALTAYVLLALTGAGFGLRSYRRGRRRRREMREARQKRALAEEQRQVITRLNRSLEPLELARTIGEELVRVTGARAAQFGYVAEELPRELALTDEESTPPSREDWRRRLDAADGHTTLAIDLRVAERPVARVLLEAAGGADGFDAAHRDRLKLFEEMAGQALHNTLLLQRVRALAERAEQASNAKSEFLATMSHEIRTPLHGVLGMVELLHETETEPGQQDILDTLRQSGLQLQRIIDDVLDISRIEAGRMRLSAQPFDLSAMLEQVVDLHAPNAARKGLDLRLRLAADLPFNATGDSDRICQVVGNLLSNAVKFTESGGIELCAEVASDGRLVIIVADSGPGIGRADRERLFEPFTQLDASITRSHSGSGLGLAICRRLVDAMDGTLDLMHACHRGSRFRLRLPVLEHADAPDAGRLTGLLADTTVCASVDPPTLRVLHRLGRRWGVRVVDVRRQPRACSLLLIDPRTLDDSDASRLDDWRRRARHVAWLQSPFGSRSGSAPVLPEGAHFLRWPLVESRLIGLLLDLRIAGDDDAAGEDG